MQCVCSRRGAECWPRHRAGQLLAVLCEGSAHLRRAWRARAQCLQAPGRAPGLRLTRCAGARQLLAALWLLRALSRRCRLRFAGRVALAQGVRFLGPTGAPCTPQRRWLAHAAKRLGTLRGRAHGPLAQSAVPLVCGGQHRLNLMLKRWLGDAFVCKLRGAVNDSTLVSPVAFGAFLKSLSRHGPC